MMHIRYLALCWNLVLNKWLLLFLGMLSLLSPSLSLLLLQTMVSIILNSVGKKLPILQRCHLGVILACTSLALTQIMRFAISLTGCANEMLFKDCSCPSRPLNNLHIGQAL